MTRPLSPTAILIGDGTPARSTVRDGGRIWLPVLRPGGSVAKSAEERWREWAAKWGEKR